jgi:hypothetical protein
MSAPGPSCPPSATPTLREYPHLEGLVEKTLADVGDEGIDPRLGHLPSGSQQDVDGGLARQLSHLVHHYNVQHSRQGSDSEKLDVSVLEKPIYVCHGFTGLNSISNFMIIVSCVGRFCGRRYTQSFKLFYCTQMDDYYCCLRVYAFLLYK